MSGEGAENNPAKRVEYNSPQRKSCYDIWLISFKEKWEVRCFHLVCGFILKHCYGCGNSQACSDLPAELWLSDGDLRDEACFVQTVLSPDSGCCYSLLYWLFGFTCLLSKERNLLWQIA